MRACQQRFGRRWRRSKARDWQIEIEAFWVFVPKSTIVFEGGGQVGPDQERRSRHVSLRARARSWDWFVWREGRLRI